MQVVDGVRYRPEHAPQAPASSQETAHESAPQQRTRRSRAKKKDREDAERG